MKKLLCFFLALGLMFTLLTGCGKKNSVPQKSEETLKEEIRAELEVELKKEEDLKAQIKAEMEAENKIDASTANENQSNATNSPDGTGTGTSNGNGNDTGTSTGNGTGNSNDTGTQSLEQKSSSETIDIGSLQVRSSFFPPFGNCTIQTLQYKPDKEFIIELKGEFTMIGSFIYNEYFEGISFLSDENSAHIRLKLDEDTFINLDDTFYVRNQDSLKKQLGKEKYDKLTEDPTYSMPVEIKGKDFAFGAMFSEFYQDSAADIIEIIAYPAQTEVSYIDNAAKDPSMNSQKNDISEGYTYRVDNGILKLKYSNTGNEIDLVTSHPAINDDITTHIADFLNIQKSHDGAKLYFEVIGPTLTNFIHVVDLNTLEEKFFTDGWFIRNVGEEPYADAVIVQKTYIPEDSARIVSYFVLDSQGNILCELGDKINEENIIGQIYESMEK